ncbi:MAG: type I methionyl aminopeptidase [Thermomicrobiales bacterium]
MAIGIKNPREIERMRAAGDVVAICHQRVEAAIGPGVTTADLDTLVRDTIREHGAVSNFFGHQGFQGYICASINDEIVHGVPGPRALQDGDIISVDIGAIVEGWHSDSAWTYGVGVIGEDARRLLIDAEASLLKGIEEARVGNRTGAIGHAVESSLAPLRYGIIREYGGHGIGRQMWEEPHIANFGEASGGVLLRAGMVLAIEPMVTLGGEATRVLDDNWTIVTRDGSLAAHFEHTVAITADGPLILTPRLVSVVH